MHRLLTSSITVVVLLLFGFSESNSEEAQILDDFAKPAEWQSAPSDGVAMLLSSAAGTKGNGLRFDFDFQGHAGWASAIKPLVLDLPENYVFEFDLRGQAPPNHLEVKFVDDTGENVWWMPYRNIEFSDDWQRMRIKKRHIRRAWGPDGDRPLRSISSIQFTIAASEGGKGSFWIDELTFQPLEALGPYNVTPKVRSSSQNAGIELASVLQKSQAGGWQPKADDDHAWLEIDFLRLREFGGLVLHWGENQFAANYTIHLSDDGEHWEERYEVRNGNGLRDYIPLPESEARFIRLQLEDSDSSQGARLRYLEVAPLEFSQKASSFFERVAADAPAGMYPKYFSGKQSYWNVVGVERAREEALINEQGLVELGTGLFSLEPFLTIGDQRLTWNDVKTQVSLQDGYLPIPTVTWKSLTVELKVTAFAAGTADDSQLHIGYLLTNHSSNSQQGSLQIALRPFQVNPSWQFLGRPGGVSPIHRIEIADSLVTVNERQRVQFSPTPQSFSTATFDEGGLAAALEGGRGSGRPKVVDEQGYGTAVFDFPFDLPAGEEQWVWANAPFPDGNGKIQLKAPSKSFHELQEEVSHRWQQKLDGLKITLPAKYQRIADTMRSNLAYIMINQDGPGIQPGSRSYQRSWIRDGALTSAALLRMGKFDMVRDFLEWYAPFQLENGKVPCAVDSRGADSVPEHDSHGQLVYAIAEYHRFTGDDDLARRLWPHVVKSVAYIQELRAQRMTEEYETEQKRAYFGLVPESISHEGYSAKPMHSYWDNLFVLRGLKDAAYLARVLGKEQAAEDYAQLSEEFRRALVDSLTLAMQQHEIDYLPGCVELGDFDATSTTVAVAPCGEAESMPQAALRNTFDKYWSDFVARRDSGRDWNDYTPYEWRVVGTLIRLGEKQRAAEATDFFFGDSRPPEWNHWAEVVHRNRDEPCFIGDMPHTWVGSDFIRSILDAFAYDREVDESVVVGAGILESWLQGTSGIGVRGLRCHHGSLDVSWVEENGAIIVELDGPLRVPPGGIHVHWPLARQCRGAFINGEAVPLEGDSHIVVRKFPAQVEFRY